MLKLLTSLYYCGFSGFMRRYHLKKKWSLVKVGMTLQEAEKIMGLKFHLDSENKSGRMVYSNHEKDYLPFYLVLCKKTEKISKKHEIVALEDLY